MSKVPSSLKSLDLNEIVELENYFCQGSMGNSEILTADHNILLSSLCRIINFHLGYTLDLLNLPPHPALKIVARSVVNETYAKLRDGNKIDEVSIRRFENLEKVCRSQKFSGGTGNWKNISILSDWEKMEWEKEIKDIVTLAMSKESLEFPLTFLKKTPKHAKQLKLAINILDCVIPRLAFHTLSLIDAFAVVKAPFTSAYNNEAPCMFIINEEVLDDCLGLADTLIHEALHEKMAQMRVTHHLLRPGYNDFDSESAGHVRLPWPNCEAQPRFFSVARALATYHYYVHSAFFLASVLSFKIPSLEKYETEDILFRLDRSFGRADYIKRSLEQPQCLEEMGEDGKSFVDWMNVALLSIEKKIFADRSLSSAWK